MPVLTPAPAPLSGRRQAAGLPFSSAAPKKAWGITGTCADAAFVAKVETRTQTQINNIAICLFMGFLLKSSLEAGDLATPCFYFFSGEVETRVEGNTSGNMATAQVLGPLRRVHPASLRQGLLSLRYEGMEEPEGGTDGVNLVIFRHVGEGVACERSLRDAIHAHISDLVPGDRP